MKKTDKRIRLCTTLLVCLLVFIWGNSLMPAPVSQAISNFVQQLLSGISIQPDEVPAGSGLLRKLAHFTEFTALGILLCWRFGMMGKHQTSALLSGIAAACTDETIQAFVPGRAPRLFDVCIDSLGVLTGIGLLLLGHTYLKKRSAT